MDDPEPDIYNDSPSEQPFRLLWFSSHGLVSESESVTKVVFARSRSVMRAKEKTDNSLTEKNVEKVIIMVKRAGIGQKKDGGLKIKVPMETVRAPKNHETQATHSVQIRKKRVKWEEKQRSCREPEH